MDTPNKAWSIFRALALAAIAGICTGVGTAFAVYSASRIIEGQAESMDALGFVFGALGWLVGWGVWKLAKGKPGAWLIKWLLITIAVGEPAVWTFFKALSGIMMRD